jgi:hypothetical protein
VESGQCKIVHCRRGVEGLWGIAANNSRRVTRELLILFRLWQRVGRGVTETNVLSAFPFLTTQPLCPVRRIFVRSCNSHFHGVSRTVRANLICKACARGLSVRHGGLGKRGVMSLLLIWHRTAPTRPHNLKLYRTQKYDRRRARSPAKRHVQATREAQMATASPKRCADAPRQNFIARANHGCERAAVDMSRCSRAHSTSLLRARDQQGEGGWW